MLTIHNGREYLALVKTGSLILLGCCGLLLSCGRGPDGGSDERPLIVATTTMVADLARAVGGDRVRVECLMGPGVDPHNFVPKLADTRLLGEADVVLYSGLHLEGKLQSVLESMADRGANVVAVTDGIPQDELLAPQEEFEGVKDPHVWGDAALWAKTVDVAVAAMARALPGEESGFRERGEAYRDELLAADEWVRSKLAGVPEEKRILVTSHDAFFYFGRAYGLRVRGLQGVSTATEAGIRDRSELVGFLRKNAVQTVFAETSTNAKGIAAVAAEAGVRVSNATLFSDALGAPGEMERVDGEAYDLGTVEGMLKHNVNAILQGIR